MTNTIRLAKNTPSSGPIIACQVCLQARVPPWVFMAWQTVDPAETACKSNRMALLCDIWRDASRQLSNVNNALAFRAAEQRGAE